MKIDHIAIAVNDVEESAKVYQQANYQSKICTKSDYSSNY